MINRTYTKYQGYHDCDFCNIAEAEQTSVSPVKTNHNVAYVVNDNYVVIFSGMITHYLDSSAHKEWGIKFGLHQNGFSMLYLVAQLSNVWKIMISLN